jgi:tetratricopeptide (TPR) repeat protein
MSMASEGTGERADANRAAAAADPDGALARADALSSAGRLDEAAEILESVTRVRPDQPAAWNRLAGVRHGLGDFDAALSAIEQVNALDPASVAGWCNRALVLDGLKRSAEALSCYDRAVQLAPGRADILCNRGKVLGDLHRPAEALIDLERAVAIAPTFAPAWHGRSVPRRTLGYLAEALQDVDKALALDPSFVPAWVQRGAALVEMGRFDEAKAAFERALSIAPNHAPARLNDGMLHLLRGDFARGWAGYEARGPETSAVLASTQAVPVWPFWESLAAKTIALHEEQGLGDIIQFSRYATLVRALGADVILIVPASLRVLLSSLDTGVRVQGPGEQLPRLDYQCRLASLPQRFGTTLDSIPATVPYLRADVERVSAWRARLSQGSSVSPTHGRTAPRRIGLVCSASVQSLNSRQRSIALEQFAPLIEGLRASGCEWHLVQTEVRPDDVAWLERLGIADHRPQLEDFADTAALVEVLDAVVSVDTSVAHVAGALGRPLYLLVPWVGDWRWLRDREDSPWYPSARLYRQTAPGDWRGALERLAADLADPVAGVR